ncbi:hypothetical protein PSQ40_04890 [Curvibacter sp. HBC61]|uniref:Uncharacterized protein n=1 Tax=Curvibacter cyanobacteriorum TaxID=3026422 RepID=A0ABT5MVN3_9BURK|nr:hypothetical protein [Curvibacter sp. HBC61]MDD0837902.1 hypothetical protein [Curvibacter sp. HBC61]
MTQQSTSQIVSEKELLMGEIKTPYRLNFDQALGLADQLQRNPIEGAGSTRHVLGSKQAQQVYARQLFEQATRQDAFSALFLKPAKPLTRFQRLQRRFQHRFHDFRMALASWIAGTHLE